MRFFFLISFFSILQLLLSVELGGVKFAISEKMANDALYHFYPSINEEVKCMKLDDIRIMKGVNVREITLEIPNFTLDKVKILFREQFISVSVTGLKAKIKGVLHISNILSQTNDVEIEIKEFSVSAKVRVRGQKVGNNRIIPWAEFIEPPSHKIDFNVDISGFLFLLNFVAESVAKSKIEDKIDEFIKDKSKNYLRDVINLIPTELPVDESKGLYIDYSLVEDIKMKYGYIEFNSYAFLYNKNKSQTKNKKNYALSLVPSIASYDYPNQVYVSQYSINSALYTYFITNPLSLKIDVNANILGLLLPSLFVKFPGKQTHVYLETTEPPVLDFEQNFINGDINGNITIYVEGRNDPIFACEIVLEITVEAIVMQEISISGKIDELSIEVGEISVNEAKSEFLIEHINKLIPYFLSALNEFIAKEIKYTLPIFFKNIKIEHKRKYFIINYTMKKEVYYSHLNDNLIGFGNLLKRLYFKTDPSSYRGIASSFNKIILDIFNDFINDNNVKSQYDTISQTILKIPDAITDEIKRKNIFNELTQKLSSLNTIANIPDLPLSTLGNQIYAFIEQSIGMAKAPVQVQSTQLTAVLNEYVARIVCLLEQSVFKFLNLNKDIFIWYDFDYSECYKIRDPR